MQHKLNAQNEPAAPRRAWVTPELKSLDLRKTLNGPIDWFAEEPLVGGGTGIPYGDGNCNRNPGGVCLS